MFKRLVAAIVCIAFIGSTLQVSYAQVKTQNLASLQLPMPGTMVAPAANFMPLTLKGLVIHPNNPLKFDFLMDTGNSGLTVGSQALKTESMKVMKYFLTALTIPEQDLWVNLSPYEKGRTIENNLGQTLMGRDLLAEDYILKQLTASLIYPEDDLGKKFWSEVYKQAAEKLGTTQIPVNTFNKVWIVPSEAVVWEHDGKVMIVKSHLKVMLEEDYLAMNKNIAPIKTNQIGSQSVRDIVLPVLEKQVNEGAHFAQLRQMFQAMILATWYKKTLKESIISKVYANQKKITGLNYVGATPRGRPLLGQASRHGGTPTDVELIYQRYLQAFKKGAFNYIKEALDPTTGKLAPRKYFSGGFTASALALGGMLTVLTMANPPVAVAQSTGTSVEATWKADEVSVDSSVQMQPQTSRVKTNSQLQEDLERLTLKELFSRLNGRTASFILPELIKRGQEAVPNLIEIASNTNTQLYLRWEVVRTIGTIGGDEAFNWLVSQLKDPNSSTRDTAIDALISMKDQKVIPYLVQLLTDPDFNIAKSVANYLKAQNWQPISEKEKFYFYLAQEDWESIVKMGQPIVPLLKQEYQKSNSVQDYKKYLTLQTSLDQLGINWWGRLSTISKISFVSSSLLTVGSLSTILFFWNKSRKRQNSIVTTPLQAQNNYSSQYVTPFHQKEDYKLVQLLESSNEGTLRDAAKKELIQRGWPSQLVQLKLKSKQELRAEGSQAVDQIKAIFTELNADQKILSLRLLGDISNQKGDFLLIEALKDNNQSVRVTAGIVLEKRGKDVVPQLIESLKEDRARIYAIETLGNIRDNRAVPALLEWLNKGNDDERMAIVDALVKIGDKKSEVILALQKAQRVSSDQSFEQTLIKGALETLQKDQDRAMRMEEEVTVNLTPKEIELVVQIFEAFVLADQGLEIKLSSLINTDFVELNSSSFYSNNESQSKRSLSSFLRKNNRQLIVVGISPPFEYQEKLMKSLIGILQDKEFPQEVASVDVPLIWMSPTWIKLFLKDIYELTGVTVTFKKNGHTLIIDSDENDKDIESKFEFFSRGNFTVTVSSEDRNIVLNNYRELNKILSSLGQTSQPIEHVFRVNTPARALEIYSIFNGLDRSNTESEMILKNLGISFYKDRDEYIQIFIKEQRLISVSQTNNTYGDYKDGFGIYLGPNQQIYLVNRMGSIFRMFYKEDPKKHGVYVLDNLEQLSPKENLLSTAYAVIDGVNDTDKAMFIDSQYLTKVAEFAPLSIDLKSPDAAMESMKTQVYEWNKSDEDFKMYRIEVVKELATKVVLVKIRKDGFEKEGLIIQSDNLRKKLALLNQKAKANDLAEFKAVYEDIYSNLIPVLESKDGTAGISKLENVISFPGITWTDSLNRTISPEIHLIGMRSDFSKKLGAGSIELLVKAEYILDGKIEKKTGYINTELFFNEISNMWDDWKKLAKENEIIPRDQNKLQKLADMLAGSYMTLIEQLVEIDQDDLSHENIKNGALSRIYEHVATTDVVRTVQKENHEQQILSLYEFNLQNKEGIEMFRAEILRIANKIAKEYNLYLIETETKDQLVIGVYYKGKDNTKEQLVELSQDIADYLFDIKRYGDDEAMISKSAEGFTYNYTQAQERKERRIRASLDFLNKNMKDKAPGTRWALQYTKGGIITDVTPATANSQDSKILEINPEGVLILNELIYPSVNRYASEIISEAVYRYNKVIEDGVKAGKTDDGMIGSKAPGGIDLNANHFDLQIKRDGQGVPLPVAQQSLENINIQGFEPTILEIKAVDLPALLGVTK